LRGAKSPKLKKLTARAKIRITSNDFETALFFSLFRKLYHHCQRLSLDCPLDVALGSEHLNGYVELTRSSP